MGKREKLVTINSSLNDIKSVILDKGIVPQGDITTYASAISSIRTVDNENLIVTPNASMQELTPSSNKTGFGSVTVNPVTSAIDNNIIAENIKKDVSILGVTGTYEPTLISKTITSNGTYSANVDNVDGYSSVTVSVSGSGNVDSGGKYLIKVIDYDGTVIKSDHLNYGDTFTLPSSPSHSGLVFQSWSSPVQITNNTITVPKYDITIGATYTTVSGLSEFDICLNSVTGLTVNLYMNGTKDWGDGSSDTSTTHTYSNEGNYTITCNGDSMSTSDSSGLFGQSYAASNHYVRNARLANVYLIGSSAFTYCTSLKTVTIPSGVTSIYNYAFYQCFSLNPIIIPSGVTTIGNSVFGKCQSLTAIALPYGITSIGTSSFQYCYLLTSLALPNSITSIGNNSFYDCLSLKSINILNGVTSIKSGMFQYCWTLPSLIIPDNITTIEDSAFTNCYILSEYDFTSHSSVPTLNNTNAFSGINDICQIKVPANLYNAWKTANNWSSYSDYIVAA